MEIERNIVGMRTMLKNKMIYIDESCYKFMPLWMRVAYLYELKMPRTNIFEFTPVQLNNLKYPLEEKIPAYLFLWIDYVSKYIGYPMVLTTELYSAAEDWNKTCFCKGRHESIQCLKNLFLYAQINKLSPHKIIARQFLDTNSNECLPNGRPLSLQASVGIEGLTDVRVQSYWNKYNLPLEYKHIYVEHENKLLELKETLNVVIRNSQKLAFYTYPFCIIDWLYYRKDWWLLGLKQGTKQGPRGESNEGYSLQQLRYACESQYSGELLASCVNRYRKAKKVVLNKAGKKPYRGCCY